MKITRQTEYAIKTLLELARLPLGEVLQTRIISKNQEIPELFLKKTIQILARAGYVRTQRGTQGGVSLIVPPEEISLADVLVAIEGEVAINQCLEEGEHCPNEEFCQVRLALEQAQEAMLDKLSQETIAGIVSREGKAVK